MPTLEEIYQEHYTFVWRIARRLGVGDAALDDVVQEVFVVMHRRAHELDMGGSIKALLYGVTRRIAGRVRDTAKQRERRLAVVADPLTPAPSEDPEARALLEERAAVVREALDAMDEDKRMVFVLTHVEGMSIPEAATILEVNVNTAYARARAARELVSKAIARHRARDERIRVHATR